MIGRKRTFMRWQAARRLHCGMTGAALAQDMPAPFDNPGDVQIALVRYLSTGDFFQAYLSGVEKPRPKRSASICASSTAARTLHLQADMVDQAIALGVDGIIIQHGLTESMREAAQRAVDAGIKVVAFDVNVENDAIPQIEQSDYLLGKLALDQAIKTMAPSGQPAMSTCRASPRSTAAMSLGRKSSEENPGINEVARFGTLDNPIANSNANQARSVLQANPNINVVFSRRMTSSPKAW
jgi:simple sugar transport system substrate-binding protein